MNGANRNIMITAQYYHHYGLKHNYNLQKPWPKYYDPNWPPIRLFHPKKKKKMKKEARIYYV